MKVTEEGGTQPRALGVSMNIWLGWGWGVRGSFMGLLEEQASYLTVSRLPGEGHSAEAKKAGWKLKGGW